MKSDHDFENWFYYCPSPIKKLPKELVQIIWQAGGRYWKATSDSYQEAARFELDVSHEKLVEHDELGEEFLILHGLEHLVEPYTSFMCRMSEVEEIQDLDEYFDCWDEL
jgi:hypothetical protein